MWEEGVTGYHALRIAGRVVAVVDERDPGVYEWELLKDPQQYYGSSDDLDEAKRAAARQWAMSYPGTNRDLVRDLCETYREENRPRLVCLQGGKR